MNRRSFLAILTKGTAVILAAYVLPKSRAVEIGSFDNFTIKERYDSNPLPDGEVMRSWAPSTAYNIDDKVQFSNGIHGTIIVPLKGKLYRL